MPSKSCILPHVFHFLPTVIPTAAFSVGISGASEVGQSCSGIEVPSEICSAPDICVAMGETLQLSCLTNLQSDGIHHGMDILQNPYSVTVTDRSVEGVYTCSSESEVCGVQYTATRCVFVYG